MPLFLRRALLLLVLSVASASAEEPWPGVSFNEVRAYAWLADDGDPIIVSGMKLRPRASKMDGVQLNPQQIARLRAAVRNPVSLHDILGGRSSPYNGFVFYDAKKNPVAYLKVRFGILGVTGIPKVGVFEVNLLALAQLFEELKLPIGQYPDIATFEAHLKAHQ